MARIKRPEAIFNIDILYLMFNLNLPSEGQIKVMQFRFFFADS